MIQTSDISFNNTIEKSFSRYVQWIIGHIRWCCEKEGKFEFHINGNDLNTILTEITENEFFQVLKYFELKGYNIKIFKLKDNLTKWQKFKVRKVNDSIIDVIISWHKELN